MDKVDKQILRSLAANSRTSLNVLAGKVGVAAPSTSDRLKRQRPNSRFGLCFALRSCSDCSSAADEVHDDRD